jgi:hypothetical protein
MGQIIELHEWRRGRPGKVGPPGDAFDWASPASGYIDAAMVPWALWRSLFASYATLWLAPFGMEVRPIGGRAPADKVARATTRR